MFFLVFCYINDLRDNDFKFHVKRRTRADIAAAMLDIAQAGAKKTRLMYRAALSYEQLSEYLELLTERGLLDYVEAEKTYRITDKGRHFLRIYKEIDEIIPSKKPPEL